MSYFRLKPRRVKVNFHENLGLNGDPVGACATATQGELKPMSRKNLVPLALLSVLFVVPTSQVTAANMRSFIEAVRRKAPFVYVGSVKQVESAHTNQVRHQSTGDCGHPIGNAKSWHEPSRGYDRLFEL